MFSLRWTALSRWGSRLRILFILTSGWALTSSLCQSYANKKVSVSEMTFDSPVDDIQWAGTNFSVVLVRTQRRRLFSSMDFGKTWAERTDDLVTAIPDDKVKRIDVTQILVNSADRNVVIIVGSKRTHLISNDAAKTFRALTLRGSIHNYVFHPKRSAWGLLSTWTPACNKQNPKGKDGMDCNHSLWVTKDLGKTFRHIASYVVQYSWGDSKVKTTDNIYYSHHRHKLGPQFRAGGWSKNIDFVVTETTGSSHNVLLSGGNKFMISNGYIFVAKTLDEDAQTVSLLVSTNGGRKFKESKLPLALTQKSYTILDTSEGAVVIQATHGSEPLSKADTGHIYTSDALGERFALSLPGALKTPTGEAEFEKMQSLDGVYIANFKDTQHPEDDNDGNIWEKSYEDFDDTEEEEAYETAVERRHRRKSGKSESVVRTVITYDKGGSWHYLKPPRVDSRGKEIQCPSPQRCWLHLHGLSSFHNFAPFYSVPNAVGIIMGTGNVGSQLRYEDGDVNTFISRDGGVTWTEAHKGAYIYEFGDHGGLIVMADDIRQTNQVVFSWNEGQSWYDFTLGSTPLAVDNIVIEPNSSSTEFLLYGTRGDAGVLYHLDFSTLQQPPCKGVWAADSVSSDYEMWSPSDGLHTAGQRCLLGREVVYTRRKQTSECFNGKDFSRPVVKTNCACTEEDYECDFGFTRKIDSVECVPDMDSAALLVPFCRTGKHFMADAYRKVPGDSCVGGWQPPKVAVPCPPGSPFSRGAKTVLVSLGLVAAFVGAVTVISRSPELSSLFFNIGFSGYENVRYTVLGINKNHSNRSPKGFSTLESANEMVTDDEDDVVTHSETSATGHYQARQRATATAKGRAAGRIGRNYEPELGFIEAAQEEDAKEVDPPSLVRYGYHNRDVSSDEDLFDMRHEDAQPLTQTQSPDLSPSSVSQRTAERVPRLPPPRSGQRMTQLDSPGG